MAVSEITGSIQPKNNIFYAVLNLKDENGKRKLKWISTGLPVRGNKTKAKEVLKQLLDEYNENQRAEKAAAAAPPVPAVIDFMAYLQSWLNKKQGNLQDLTVESYQTLISGKIRKYFAPMNLALPDITPEHIESFFEHLYGEGISPNTVLHYYTLLHTAFRDATRRKGKKLIAINPMDDIDRPGCDVYEASFYNTQEVMLLFEAAKKDQLFIVILITAYYGLRRSEVLGIKWNAIDFVNNIITIRHKVYTLKRRGDRPYMIKGSNRLKAKASLRSLPLIPYVREALLAHRRQQEEYKRLFGSTYDMEFSEYVCVWPNGKLIPPDFVTRHFTVILRKNNLRRIRFHDLRHTCASLLVASGIPMKMIQEWLGHSAFQTTANLYSHLEQSAKTEVAQAMAEKLNFSDIPVLNL